MSLSTGSRAANFRFGHHDLAPMAPGKFRDHVIYGSVATEPRNDQSVDGRGSGA
jgi:hypothetical protein